MKGLIKKILREESKKKICPGGMYWCSDDKICKPDSQKMGKIGTTEEMSEGIGFIKTYETEVEEELDEFLDAVCSGIFELLLLVDVFFSQRPFIQISGGLAEREEGGGEAESLLMAMFRV